MNSAVRTLSIGLFFGLSSLSTSTNGQAITLGLYPEALTLNPNLPTIIEKTFDHAQLELLWQELPVKRSLLSANKGLLDGDIARVRWAVETMQNLRAVAEPLGTLQFWVMVPHHKNCPPKNKLDTLIAIGINGLYAHELFISKNPDHWIKAPDLDSMLKMLDKDRASYTKVPALALSTSVKGRLKPCYDQPQEQVSYHLMLHKRHQQQLEKLSNALQQVKQLHPDLFNQP